MIEFSTMTMDDWIDTNQISLNPSPTLKPSDSQMGELVQNLKDISTYLTLKPNISSLPLIKNKSCIEPYHIYSESFLKKYSPFATRIQVS